MVSTSIALFRSSLALACVVALSTQAAEPRHISGREVAAIAAATNAFKTSYAKPDLRHYSVDLRRRGKTLEVIFLPDADPSPNAKTPRTGGSTIYGPEMHYYVSLETFKILRYEFAR